MATASETGVQAQSERERVGEVFGGCGAKVVGHGGRIAGSGEQRKNIDRHEFCVMKTAASTSDCCMLRGKERSCSKDDG